VRSPAQGRIRIHGQPVFAIDENEKSGENNRKRTRLSARRSLLEGIMAGNIKRTEKRFTVSPV
jgi:hypothetical protein